MRKKDETGDTLFSVRKAPLDEEKTMCAQHVFQGKLGKKLKRGKKKDMNRERKISTHRQ